MALLCTPTLTPCLTCTPPPPRSNKYEVTDCDSQGELCGLVQDNAWQELLG